VKTKLQHIVHLCKGCIAGLIIFTLNPINTKILLSMKNHSSKFRLLLIFGLLLLLVSCAPGNERFDLNPAGFWLGLWHGFISFFTFIISLFNDNVAVYETNNSGHLYDLGFILGIMFFYGGGSKGTCKRRR